jgi:hypothetical protein
MSDGNIRSAALTWFDSTHPSIKEPILASKFYTRDESWSKTKVWFFQVPLEYIEPNKIKYLHFLCENHLQGDDFIYLKIPTLFLLKNEKSFEVDRKEKVMRIYLSAEAADMFKEVRKGSKIDFGKYVQK